MDKDSKQTLPKVLDTKEVAKTRLIAIDEVQLKFSNGEQRTYEKVRSGGRGAVLIVPMLDDDTMLLIREYSAGTHSYQLGFPKGLIDPGENAEQAANRELQEEIHMASNNITFLKQVCLAPAFFNARMDLFIATDLIPSKLIGDEPEPLQVVPWKLSEYQQLLAQPDFTEARSITALMLAREYLEERYG
ncbi:ADP compounds hydrolase NudE [Thalassotalea aquiviva]|uniref:ADP compounds hydrolase NudE n=1 Tax=Thalassotalea aquiviva TaxID=3242415 RepID=UPI00352AE8A9